MAQTRAVARKRRGVCEAQEKECILQQDPAACVLEDVEIPPIQSMRKKRKETREKGPPAVDMILPELLPRIMLYLDDSTDIYSLSKCAKYVRAAITPEIIIRSAIFAGGRKQKAMQSIMELVLRKAVHTPSPFRLLRMVNAKRCERMSNCYGFNIVTGRSESLGTASATHPWGLAICERCATGLGNRSIIVSYASPLCSLDVLARHGISTLGQPQFEETTRTPIGSYLLSQHVYQVASTFRGHAAEQKEYLAKLHGELSASESEGYRQNLVHIYTEAMSEYESFKASKKRLKNEKKEAKRAARAEKKKEDVSRVYEKVSCLLEGHKRKSSILRGCYRNDGNFLLKFGPSRVILGPLLSAPSSASQKKIKRSVQGVKEIFELIETNGFFDWSFLEKLKESHVPPYKRALINFCKSQVYSSFLLTKGYLDDDEDYQSLAPWESEVIDYTNFNQYLKDGHLWQAVFATMSYSEIRTAAIRFFVRSPVSMSDSVVRDASMSMSVSKRRRLAHALWNCRDRSCDTLEEFQTTFRACNTQFMLLSQNYHEYLNDENTKQFLAETSFPDFRGIPLHRYTRQDAIDKVLELHNRTQGQALANRDYGRLLQIHRDNFNRGYTLIR